MLNILQLNLSRRPSTRHAEQLTAWVDNVKNEPLISVLPKKGSIKSEKENTKFGYKELTLSNGARVLLKKTDYKDDEVILSATSKGGASLLGKEDYANIKMFDNGHRLQRTGQLQQH